MRVTGGVICALAGILNMGLFPKMGATFITFATGLGDSAGDAELTVNVITSLLIVLVLVYTVLGGMVAVIVTDYVQFVVLSLGLGAGPVDLFLKPRIGLGHDGQHIEPRERRGSIQSVPSRFLRLDLRRLDDLRDVYRRHLLGAGSITGVNNARRNGRRSGLSFWGRPASSPAWRFPRFGVSPLFALCNSIPNSPTISVPNRWKQNPAGRRKPCHF